MAKVQLKTNTTDIEDMVSCRARKELKNNAIIN